MQLDLKDYNAFTFIPYPVEFDVNYDTDRTQFCIAIYFLNFFLKKFWVWFFLLVLYYPSLTPVPTTTSINEHIKQNKVFLNVGLNDSYSPSIFHILQATTHYISVGQKKRKGLVEFSVCNSLCMDSYKSSADIWWLDHKSSFLYVYLYVWIYICICVSIYNTCICINMYLYVYMYAYDLLDFPHAGIMLGKFTLHIHILYWLFK